MARAGRRSTSSVIVAAVWLSVALVAVGCGDGRGGGSQPMRTIGILRAVVSPQPQNQEFLLATLAEEGWVQGENLTVRGLDPAQVHPDPGSAMSVVRSWSSAGLDLVVALSSAGAKAAAEGAPGTNVLFLSNDPVAIGLVDDERRPGGNLTGATFRVPADRTLDLARRAVPGSEQIGYLVPRDDPASSPSEAGALEAASRLGIELVVGTFGDVAEVEPEVGRMVAQGITSLVLANAPTTVRAMPAIAAATTTIPVIANVGNDFALVVLEPDTAELYRQLGRQAARLLEGTPVAEVPVEDPARFRFVLNLSAAQRLGIEVPPDVVDSADVVVP